MKIRFLNHRLPVRLGLLILLSISLAGGALAVMAAGSLSLPVSRVTSGGKIMTGGRFTVVGAAGQTDAGRLNGGSLRVNGGVIGERITQPQPPVLKTRSYLPIAWQNYPQWLLLKEAEPNNLFSQANPIPSLPALVSGSHDGAAGGGDVFCLSLEAGRGFEVSLATGDAIGIQLLAYDAAGTEIARDYTEPFDLTLNTLYNGSYYVYVFSAPEADNYASYTLTIRAGSLLSGIETTTAPAVDVESLGQSPQVQSTP